MRPGAIMCNQGECILLHLDLIGTVLRHCTTVFPSVDYAFTTIPTYPSGQIGFIMCSLDDSRSALVKPKRAPVQALQDKLKYYSPEIHSTAFVLPQFAAKELQKVAK